MTDKPDKSDKTDPDLDEVAKTFITELFRPTPDIDLDDDPDAMTELTRRLFKRRK